MRPCQILRFAGWPAETALAPRPFARGRAHCHSNRQRLAADSRHKDGHLRTTSPDVRWSHALESLQLSAEQRLTLHESQESRHLSFQEPEGPCDWSRESRPI